MARRVFYSFHYDADSWRAATVRSIGSIEGNAPASDNDWEAVTAGGESAIKMWIADQMVRRSCTVVLVGSNTAGRKWINYEIVKSWNEDMGVVGIHVHGLKNADRMTSPKGRNPFSSISCGSSGQKLSSIVKCYDPLGRDSKERYAWIRKYLESAVEEAVRIRKAH